MKKRTKEEIAAEIAALNGLNPSGQYAKVIANLIETSRLSLESDCYDDPKGKWLYLSLGEQRTVFEAHAWRDGHEQNSPSSFFARLC